MVINLFQNEDIAGLSWFKDHEEHNGIDSPGKIFYLSPNENRVKMNWDDQNDKLIHHIKILFNWYK